MFIGVEGEAIGVTGPEGSVGIVWDTDHPMESGLFLQFGFGAGANVGGALCGGFTLGDIEGWGSDLDVNLHPYAPTLFFNEIGLAGGSMGVGPGAGISIGATYGWTLTIETIIGWFTGP